MTASASLPRTFKKSFTAYLGLFARTLLLLAVPVGVALAADSSGVQLGFGILAALILARQIYRFFYMRSIRWVVSDGHVVVRAGLLPWRKWSFDHPYETMFEAFYQHGFFGHFLNYGTCTIRRSEGVTSALSERQMHDAKTLVGIVNSKIASARAAKAGAPVIAQVTQFDGLAELARLRANGDLTADEFEALKARIIGGSAGESMPA
jgi:hypothetical protein